MRRLHPLTALVVPTALAAALVAAPAPAAVRPAPIDRGAAARVAAVPAAGDDHVDHVLAISVDGLNPEALHRLGPSGTPNLHRMIAEGAATLNARTALESTSTLPNHTGMLTSRRVDPARDGHGVDFNDDADLTTVHRAAGHYVASVYDVVHDHGGSTALYTSKDKFAMFDRSWSADHGSPDDVGADDGRDKIDRFVYREDEDVLTKKLRRKLRNAPPAFTLLHLSVTDKTGHARGYMKPAYLRAVRAVDTRVGRLLRTVERTPQLSEHLVVVLTSDHGGLGRSHSAARRRVNYTVPFVVWGPGVAAGADLYRLNDGYQDPGTGRPGYRAEAQPIRNAALANLAANLLDLPAVPGSGINTGRILTPFAP